MRKKTSVKQANNKKTDVTKSAGKLEAVKMAESSDAEKTETGKLSDDKKTEET